MGTCFRKGSKKVGRVPGMDAQLTDIFTPREVMDMSLMVQKITEREKDEILKAIRKVQRKRKHSNMPRLRYVIMLSYGSEKRKVIQSR